MWKMLLPPAPPLFLPVACSTNRSLKTNIFFQKSFNMFKGALLIALSAVVAAEDLTEDNFRYPGDGTGGGRPVGGFNEGGLVEREDRGTTVAPPFIPPTVCSSQITKWKCMVSKLFLRALFINSASLPAFRSRRSHAAPGSYLIHALEVQHIRALPVQQQRSRQCHLQNSHYYTPKHSPFSLARPWNAVKTCIQRGGCARLPPSLCSMLCACWNNCISLLHSTKIHPLSL